MQRTFDQRGASPSPGIFYNRVNLCVGFSHTVQLSSSNANKSTVDGGVYDIDTTNFIRPHDQYGVQLFESIWYEQLSSFSL